MKKNLIALLVGLLIVAGSAWAQPCIPTLDQFLTHVGESACIIVCPGSSIQVCVTGPLSPGQIPRLGILASCDPAPRTLCNFPCPFQSTGIYWTYDPTDWTYVPATGMYCTHVYGIEPGCLCITLEGFLAVEMGDLIATPGDGRVDLRWNTLSETALSSFEVYRTLTGSAVEPARIATITAHNSATGAEYSYSDHSVDNGLRYTYSLTTVNTDGSRTETGLFAEASPAPNAGVSNAYALYPSYPNPFNPSTQLRFNLAEAGRVNLTVYNTTGQTVAELIDGPLAAGLHTVNFNGANLPSGWYIYKLNAGNSFSAARSMLLLK